LALISKQTLETCFATSCLCILDIILFNVWDYSTCNSDALCQTCAGLRFRIWSFTI